MTFWLIGRGGRKGFSHFAQKFSFGLRGVKMFIPNLDHLLGLAFPENLSSIGLMVEAVDEFCGQGRAGEGRGGEGTGCDYIDNLSPSFCF